MRISNTKEQREKAKTEGKSLFVAGFSGLKMSGVLPRDTAGAMCLFMVLVSQGKIPADEIRKLAEKYNKGGSE